MLRSKFVRFILLIFALIVLAIGVYYLGLWLKWPFWFACSVYAGIIGIFVAIVFIRRWLFRRREREFVERVVKQDLSRLPVEEDRQAHREVEKRFLAAIEVLKTSELSKRGNPVYMLPWFMLLGESNSGKTMCLRRANLSALQTEFTTFGSSTSSCDWWFSEAAVIMDVAGRFSAFGDDARVRREWESLLTLLSKHRQKEPLNALIVTVSVEALLGDAERLDDYARTLRRRINELMRVMGARFPVYVLVTKMDLVPGFNALADQVDAQFRRQALGAVNSHELGGSEFTDECLQNLVSVLKDFRIMATNSRPGFDLSLLGLPESVNTLSKPLQRFSGILFDVNPYLETPLYRGLFFGSAKANDEKFADNPAAIERGAFLHDIFSILIPKDRYTFTPVKEMVRWRTTTSLLGWGSWLLISIALGSLLTISYIENRRALNTISEQFQVIASRSQLENTDNKMFALERVSNAILDMELVNKNWSVPRLGFNQSIEGEQRVKSLFGHIFVDNIQHPSDQHLLKTIDALEHAYPDTVIPLYIEHLLWRVMILKKGISGSSLASLEELRSFVKPTVLQQGLDIPADNGAVYTTLYLRNLAWNHETQNFEEQLRTWQSALARLVSYKGGQLDWLLDWANTNPVLKTVSMKEFWGRNQFMFAEDIIVPAAFTLQGKKAIESFLTEVRAASRDKELFAQAEQVFWNHYYQLYFAHWYEFALAAPIGAEITLSTDELRLMAGQISGFNNPYFLLLEKMCDEVEPITALVTPPSWYNAVRHFKLVIEEIRLRKSPKTPITVISDATHTVDKLSASMDQDKQHQARVLSELAEFLEAYQKSISDMLPAVATPQASFQFVSKVLEGPDVTSGVSYQIHRARQALDDFSRLSVGSNSSQMLVRLVGGPYIFFHNLLQRQAMEELQRIWEADVYSVAQSTPVENSAEALCDPDGGAVPAFLQGPARHFIIKRSSSYTPASFMGNNLPLAADFLSFLTCPVASAPSKQKEHRVEVLAQPTTVNKGALDEPYLTTLQLRCEGRAPQILSNYNHRISLPFFWNHESCSDVELTVTFKSFSVKKAFGGTKGFPDFIRKFQKGRVTFFPADFPAQKTKLMDLNVSEIVVGFVFENAKSVLSFSTMRRPAVPRLVTHQPDAVR